jgi:hypothetical protein
MIKSKRYGKIINNYVLSYFMEEEIDYSEIHREIQKDLESPINSIILPDANVDLDELLSFMFVQFHRIDISTNNKR